MSKQHIVEISHEAWKAIRDYQLDYIRTHNVLPHTNKEYQSIIVLAGIEALKQEA